VLQGLGVYYGVVRCVGLDKAGVDKDLAAVHQPRLDALDHYPLEEVPEHLRTPALTSLGEDAVVGDLRVEVVTQEPEPVQPLRKGGHELALGPDVVKDQKKHQLQYHRGRNRYVAPRPIFVRHFAVDEVKVHPRRDLPERVVPADPLSDAYVGVKEFAAVGPLNTHHGEHPLALPTSILRVFRCFLRHFHLKKRYSGNRPSRSDPNAHRPESPGRLK